MIFGSLLGVLILLYCAIWYSMRRYWARRKIPFEAPVVFFGNLFDFVVGKRNIAQIHKDIYLKFKGEKFVGMHNFMKPSLLIRDPNMAYQILTSKFDCFSKADIEGNDDLGIGQLTFVLSEEKWRESKQLASPIFSTSRIKSFFDDIQQTSDKLVEHLEAHPEGEVKTKMALFTCEIVASVGMGINGHSFEAAAPKMPQLAKRVFKDGLHTAINYSILFYIPFLANILKLRIVPFDVINFLVKNVQDQINIREKTGSKGTDVIQYYIDLQETKMTKADINNSVDTLSAFFLESSETTSLLLSLIILELTNNNALQKRLRDEIDKAYESTDPTYEEINDMRVLECVLLETYRHYGQLMLDRKCSKSCLLDIGDGKSFLVEEGTSLVIPVLGLHMDPNYWGENAAAFDPSRWENGFVPKKGLYLPFGAGPRMCIGKKITDATIKTALVNILRNFYLVRTKDTAEKFIQDPHHFLSQQKGGIYVQFLKRSFLP